MAAVSLKVLQGGAWRETLAPVPLALGGCAALCVSLALSWPSLVTPLVGRRLSLPAVTALAVSVTVLEVVLLPFIGVTTAAAIAERRFVPAAFARSVRLLRGLRWRVAALALGFVVALLVAQPLVQIGLAIAGLPLSRGPGWGRVVLTLPGVVVGALAGVTFASVFVQSRRLAEGPTATALVAVYGRPLRPWRNQPVPGIVERLVPSVRSERRSPMKFLSLRLAAGVSPWRPARLPSRYPPPSSPSPPAAIPASASAR